jgi:hypothetical protein
MRQQCVNSVYILAISGMSAYPFKNIQPYTQVGTPKKQGSLSSQLNATRNHTTDFIRRIEYKSIHQTKHWTI